MNRIEIEQAILGALLLDSGAYARICDFLMPKNFSSNVAGYNHQELFEIISNMYANNIGIDLRTVNYYSKGKYIYYLCELNSKVSSTDNIPDHARILLEINFRERFMETLANHLNTHTSGNTTRSVIQDIIDEALDPAWDTFQLVQEAESYLRGISEDGIAEEISVLTTKFDFRIKKCKEKATVQNTVKQLFKMGAAPYDLKTRLATEKLVDILITASASGKLDDTLATKIIDLPHPK